MSRHEIEIEIDELTPCLIHRESGEYYKTVVEPLSESDLPMLTKRHGWGNFDWSIEHAAPNRHVYKLRVEGSDVIQGLISFEIAQGYVDVFLVESAPWNIGAGTKEFVGVGAHLFAIACKHSFELGFEGVIAFTSKTNLISHYEDTLGAIRIGGHLMTIETSAAYKLVERYFGKDEAK
ncbi:hypothetical protein [Paenibacillus sp. Y412MC10]|uniref:hypothetical protein n=1 Tax=Geobacillus sp. (strain Y412MC10) TaxID=481743 RepID=UPI0011AB5576|nr:hypothetical protein [Paenibacillus sp. Y412MC10]